MKRLRLLPAQTKFDFIGRRVLSLGLSAALVLVSLGFFFIQGLNYGIDFRGGTLIEVRMAAAPDLGALRSQLSALGLGEISLQEFGEPTDVLIRIQRQEGEEAEQIRAIQAVKGTLGEDVDYRRTEFVGPKVGGELIEAGTKAVILALLAIMTYIWFRFEWQFGVCAVIALVHDVVTTIGIFSILQFEFNLATVAAILTIAGYSINDTVVIYDRVRENLRKYKKMTLADLLNLSNNETLQRTVMTSVTTLLALLALYFFGGEVIRGFVFAMIWGVLVGTYSSVFVAVPLLLYMNIRREVATGGPQPEAEAERAP
jgi:preprotein translocase subunit SecF